MLASLSITNSVQQALNSLFNFIPNLIGFALILLVGYVIARLIRKVLDVALGKLRLDQHLADSKAGAYVERLTPGGRPTKLISGVVFWFIMIFVISAAIGALKIPSVTTFMDQVLDYLPNVVAAVLIFVIAAAISGAVAAAAVKLLGDTPTGKLAGTIIPGVIMAIALFMVLTQLRIAPAIVEITYAAVLGMLALTGALAFGLGGRDVAARIWAQTYERSQQAKDQASADLSVARDRAKELVDQHSEGTPEATVQRSDDPEAGRTVSGRPPFKPPRNTDE